MAGLVQLPVGKVFPSKVLLNLEVTTCDPGFILPPIPNKPIKRIKLTVEIRRQRFIHCVYIRKKGQASDSSSSSTSRSEIKV